MPHKLPIDTDKARNLGVEHLNGCSPRVIGDAIRLCHSKQKGRRDAARANQGVLALRPPYKNFQRLPHVRNRSDSGLKIGGRCYRRFVP